MPISGQERRDLFLLFTKYHHTRVRLTDLQVYLFTSLFDYLYFSIQDHWSVQVSRPKYTNLRLYPILSVEERLEEEQCRAKISVLGLQ